MSILHYFIRMNEHAVLMEAMIGKLGLSRKLRSLPEGDDFMRKASSRCMECDCPDECAVWLVNHHSAHHAPGYCRNHDLFDQLGAVSSGQSISETPVTQNSP